MNLELRPYDYNSRWDLVITIWKFTLTIDLGSSRALCWRLRQWKRRNVRAAAREYETEDQYLDRVLDNPGYNTTTRRK